MVSGLVANGSFQVHRSKTKVRAFKGNRLRIVSTPQKMKMIPKMKTIPKMGINPKVKTTPKMNMILKAKTTQK